MSLELTALLSDTRQIRTRGSYSEAHICFLLLKLVADRQRTRLRLVTVGGWALGVVVGAAEEPRNGCLASLVGKVRMAFERARCHYLRSAFRIGSTVSLL